MAKNKIQFQKGYSLPQFYERYETEDKCRAEVFAMKWKKGFVCPRCDNKTYCFLEKKKLYQCNKCRHQTSLIAGTIFQGTKLPLTQWFLAMYFMTQTKKGISSMELGKKLGIPQNTAWVLKQKLMQVMLEREEGKKLSGRIEIDDAYMGGKLPGGKRGRGSENKIPFIAAVQTDKDGKPQKMKIAVVKGFRKTEVSTWSKKALQAGSNVVSDGLGCFNAVKDADCTIEVIVVGGKRKSSDVSAFNWVNTMLGNLKISLLGIYHSLNKRHLERYMAEFTYRFNRRENVATMIDRLHFAALRTPPLPVRLLKLAEV